MMMFYPGERFLSAENLEVLYAACDRVQREQALKKCVNK